MSLLAPLFLLGGLAAAVPVVLHLLKRHPESLVRFSAVHLLKDAPVEHASRRRLRELLLLALRIGAVALFAIAFARPYFSAAASEGGPGLIVALDTSFSMAGNGRFERARELAVRAVDDAPSGTAVGVVTFSDSAQVVSPLSTDRVLARAAIAAAQPTAGATRYHTALTAAANALRERDGGLMLVTDLQASGWQSTEQTAWPDTLGLTVADVGAMPRNLAVTDASLSGDRIVATVRNFSPAAVEARVALAAGQGAGAAAVPVGGETAVSIVAGGAADVVLPRPDGRWAVVTIADPDGAIADNSRYLVLDGPSRPQVLIVTATGDLNREAFYLQQALTAGVADAPSYDAVGVSGATLGSWDATRLASYTTVVVASTRGVDHRGRELLAQHAERGGGVLITINADADTEIVTELAGPGTVSVVPPGDRASSGGRSLVPSDPRHPILRPFSGRASLGLATFRQTATLRAGACATLAEFTDGQPALVECARGSGRVLLFASDLDNRGNDFPLHATFLPFIHEAVKYLGGDARAARYVVGAAPAGVPPTPGVAAVAITSGVAETLVAVNVDVNESDPRRLTLEEFQQAAVRAPVTERTPAPQRLASEREAQQHLWQYLLMTVMVLLVVEGLLSRRVA